jgi:hypothetical protein
MSILLSKSNATFGCPSVVSQIIAISTQVENGKTRNIFLYNFPIISRVFSISTSVVMATLNIYLSFSVT